jgi:TatD DNase family protein
VQREVFEAQLGLAREVNKPVVVHLRDKRGQWGAYELALEVLRQWLDVAGAGETPAVCEGAGGHRDALVTPGDGPGTGGNGAPGVLHCFSGTMEAARAALEMGFYLGVDGPVTYPNAGALQAMVAELPLQRLLLETDCPYLAPQARRGRRNEPGYLPYIGQKVAELQGMEVAQVARVTGENAARLFGLDLNT